MAEVKIKSASIKDGLFLQGEYSKRLSGDDSEKIKFDRTTPIHDDLAYAIKKLHKHLALLCDEVVLSKKIRDIEKWDDDQLYVSEEKMEQELPMPGMEPKEKIEKFHVTGFTIKGNEDNEGCTLSGYKIGKYGTIDLVSPKTKWNDTVYPFAGDLSSDIEDCIYEVDQYLFHDKRAPERQMSLDFPEAEEKLVEEEV